ncbi:hypothetical protein MHYP_G00334690 [Metynnis hypsauchen]
MEGEIDGWRRHYIQEGSDVSPVNHGVHGALSFPSKAPQRWESAYDQGLEGVEKRNSGISKGMGELGVDSMGSGSGGEGRRSGLRELQ